MRKSSPRNHHPIGWRVTPSWPSEPAEAETMWEQSCSRCRRACTWSSFPVTHSMEHSKLIITPMANTSTVSSQRTDTLTISRQQAKIPLGSPITQSGCHHPVLQRQLNPWGEMTPTGTIHSTRLFGRDHCNQDDIYVDAARCSDRH